MVWCFESILREIETICEGSTHVFWLMENTGSMPNEYKEAINEKFGVSFLLFFFSEKKKTVLIQCTFHTHNSEQLVVNYSCEVV